MADARVERLARRARRLLDERRARASSSSSRRRRLRRRLLRALYRRVLDAGGHPHAALGLSTASAEALLDAGHGRAARVGQPHAASRISSAPTCASTSRRRPTPGSSRASTPRGRPSASARQSLRDRYLERAAAGELRSVVTLFPTNAAAQDAEMSLADTRTSSTAPACSTATTPSAAWRELGERLERLAEWLDAAREFRVVAEGTDLTVGVEGRTWIPCDGKENFPDGEFFTGPGRDERRGRRSASRYPGDLRGRIVRGHPASLRGRRGRRGPRVAGRGLPRGDARTWTTALGGSGSSPSA